jgi:hypothetical protein
MLRELQFIDEIDNGRFHGIFIQSAILNKAKTIKGRAKNLGRALGTPAGPRLQILAVGPEARGTIFIRYRVTSVHAHLCQGGNGGVFSRIDFRRTIGSLRGLLS